MSFSQRELESQAADASNTEGPFQPYVGLSGEV